MHDSARCCSGAAAEAGNPMLLAAGRGAAACQARAADAEAGLNKAVPITWAQVLQMLERGLSCEEAAKALGCGSTYFKQTLRGFRLRVWPFRNVVSVNSALAEHAAWLQSCSPATAEAVRKEMAVLQRWRADLLQDPRKHIDGRSVCVPPEVARIIKAGHKRAHKKFNRAADALAALASAAASGP